MALPACQVSGRVQAASTACGEGSPLHLPGTAMAPLSLLWHSEGLQEGLGWACSPAWVGKGDQVTGAVGAF